MRYLLLCLLLAGCHAPRAGVWPPLRERARVEFLPGEPGPELRAELLELLDACLEVYVAEYGSAPRVSRVYLWLAPALPADHFGMSLPRHERLMGVAYRGIRVIHLAALGPQGMSAGPHELRHLAINDTDHEGPGWRRLDWLGRILARE